MAPTFRPGPRRGDDRRVVVASVVVAAGFLLVAAAAALARATGADALPPWLPLHLALAGGASTAISGVMPFFVAALAAGNPAPVRLRVTSVALVAIGAALVSVRGFAPSADLVPATGGCVYLAGIGAVALAVRASGRAGLMIRRPVVTAGYMLALLNVAIGTSLGTLAAAGWPPVLDRWAELRPAHAWTNVLGFVSLIIVSTLLHFLPTVLGTRIVPRGSAALAVMGTALAAPLVVTGQADRGWGCGRWRRGPGDGWRGSDGPGGVTRVPRPGDLDDGPGLASDVGHRAAGRGGVVRGGDDARIGARPRGRAGPRAGRGGVAVAARRRPAGGRLGRPGAGRIMDPPAAGDRAGWAEGTRRPARGAGSGRNAPPGDAQRRDGVLAVGWPLGIGVLAGTGALLAAGAVVASVGLAASALRVRARVLTAG